MSIDDVASHKKFAEEHRVPFPLLFGVFLPAIISLFIVRSCWRRATPLRIAKAEA